MRFAYSLWVVCAASMSSCATTRSGLAPNFPENAPEQLDAVRAELARAPARIAQPIAAFANEENVWAYDTSSGRLLWQEREERPGTPFVAGNAVAYAAKGQVIVRTLLDGRQLVRIDLSEMQLVGADGEGDGIVLSLSTGGGVGARSRYLAFEGARIVWELALEQTAGVPLVRGDLVFLPWAQQNLSVVSKDSGSELARIRIPQGAIGHVLPVEGGIAFGQRGLATLRSASSASSDISWFEPETSILPGAPMLLRDATQPAPLATDASHRVRLVFSREFLGASPRHLYWIFYRLVFSLDPAAGLSVQWVAQTPSDIVGATAVEDGLVFADADGRIGSISNGLVKWNRETGLTASHATVPASAYAPPSEVPPTLSEALLTAAQNPDSRLLPARLFAVSKLRGVEEQSATLALISLCESTDFPTELHDAACAALSERTDSELFISALSRHASFLEDVRPPPIQALARAAARSRDERAVPLLVRHLGDPQNSATDVKEVADALGALGDRSAVEALESFALLYHAEPDDGQSGPMIAAVLEAYASLGGPTSGEVLRFIVEDPASSDAARAAARGALSQQSPSREAESQPPAQTAAPEAIDEAPPRMTLPLVRRVLSPIDRELEACLVVPGRTHAQARALLVIEPDGTLSAVSVAPPELAGCIEPLIRSRSFPRTRARTRETVPYVLRRP